jgi:protein associated with RNAse G/E
MTTFHLALNCAKTTILKFNGSMPRVWNRQMVVDTITEKYRSVSLHVKVVNIIPQFCEITENVAYGTTTKVACWNRHAHVHEEGYPILIFRLL